tara:strand:- start:469 stop:1005 length:537 start_codon:yes stop_codon:yes gene_type:complete
METLMIKVDRINKFGSGELEELTLATIDAIENEIGFGWTKKPHKNKLLDYWNGVLLVPNRWLFVGKYQGIVSGSLQVVTPSKSNEAGSFKAFIDTHFVATWARGHGLAKLLIEKAEADCKKENFSHILLDVRETQQRAISLYEQLGYKRWGILPSYHKLENNKIVSGHFFYKCISTVN